MVNILNTKDKDTTKNTAIKELMMMPKLMMPKLMMPKLMMPKKEMMPPKKVMMPPKKVMMPPKTVTKMLLPETVLPKPEEKTKDHNILLILNLLYHTLTVLN